MATPKELKTVAVIGNGIIGHGVAEVFAAGGAQVRMIGRRLDSLKAALGKIRASLRQFADNGLTTKGRAAAALKRITVSTDMTNAAGADLVIEAVPEDMDLKTELFGRLDRLCPPPAVLATSSGHPASEVVGKVSRRERVVAAHFWFPPQLIPLVEVCGGPETASDVVTWTCDVLRAVGKQPVVIAKEVPGFIGNRIQFAALREAWSLWASGAASAEAIDAVVRYSIGRRLGVTGPIELADLGGLDTFYNFARFLQPTLDAAPMPPDAIARLAAAGHRGMSSGRGAYDWSSRDGAALLAARKAELIRWLKVDAVRQKKAKKKPAKAKSRRK